MVGVNYRYAVANKTYLLFGSFTFPHPPGGFVDVPVKH
jgi:hypothetical protein